MKTISATLDTHIQKEVTTLATLYKIVRLDNQVFYFTDHDQDLTYDNHIWKSANGYSRSTLQMNASMASDATDIVGTLDNDVITKDDLRSGKWNRAAVFIYQVNWNDLSLNSGCIKLSRGWFGEVALKNQVYQVEFRSLTSALQTRIGQLYSPICRAEFGNNRCKIDVDTFQPSSISNYEKVSVVVAATSRPWTCSINPTLEYGIHDGTNPTVLPLALTEGDRVSIVYTGGTIRVSDSRAPVDAMGDVSAPINITADKTSGEGKYYPTHYMTEKWLGLGGLCGAFTNNNGVVIQTLMIGLGHAYIVPAGATKLQLGINDDQFVDNTGSFSVDVTVGASMPDVLQYFPTLTSGDTGWANPPLAYDTDLSTFCEGADAATVAGPRYRIFNGFGALTGSPAGAVLKVVSSVDITTGSGCSAALEYSVNDGTNWLPMFSTTETRAFNVDKAILVVAGLDSTKIKVRAKIGNTPGISFKIFSVYLETGGATSANGLWQEGVITEVFDRGRFKVSNIEGGSTQDIIPPAPTVVTEAGGTFAAGLDVYFRLVLKTNQGTTSMGYATIIQNSVLNSRYVVTCPELASNFSGVTDFDVFACIVSHGQDEPAYSSYIRMNEPNHLDVVTGTITVTHFPDQDELNLTWVPKGGTKAPVEDTSGLGLVGPNGFMNLGMVQFLTGAGTGISMVVKAWDAENQIVTLYLRMPVAIEVGDTFKIRPGCNKSVAACKSYGNILNMRAEPYVPGRDHILWYPNQKT